MEKDRLPALKALTSLRFFACAMIVIMHAEHNFGIPRIADTVALGAGVSFFFVLSGFILAYNYPVMKGWPAIGRFLRARFARLWPAHIAALAFVMWWTYSNYIHDTEFWTRLALNVTMTQTWVPTRELSFSFNGPSWSIATEFFFYLTFPFFLANIGRTWWWKLPLAAAPALALGAFAAASGLTHSDPATATDYALLFYDGPQARLLEFVVGLCAAVAWSNLRPRYVVGPIGATAIELGALALFALTITVIGAPNVSNPLIFWWYSSAHTAVPSALLIAVMACGRGWISRALSWKALVFLGEISYAMYLIHFPLLRVYWDYQGSFKDVPVEMLGVIFICVLLTFSCLIYWAIELPLRRLIRGKKPVTQRSHSVKSSFSFPQIEALRVQAGV